MAELSVEQRAAVKEWVSGGASLSEVQRRLKEEFDLTLTYMDVRLMTLEIGAEVQDKPEPPKAQEEPTAADDAGGDELDGDAPDADGAAGGGGVTVSLDRVMRPGAVASGEVTFSDGKKATWMLDQMGRLGLDGVPKGYQPAQEDVRDFQMQLQQLLSRGY